jgi:hypothetical protein
VFLSVTSPTMRMPRSAPGLGPWAAPDGLCGRMASGYYYHLASGGSRDGGPFWGPPEPALHPWGVRATPGGSSRWSACPFLPGELGRGKQKPAGTDGRLRPPSGSRGDHLSDNLSAPHGTDGPERVPNDSYLVDSASSHMLVSKIKPCMSKYKQLYRETANGSLYKLSFI